MKRPPNFPALLESFFTQRLMAQRQASPHTIASYRDTFRLLLNFAQKQRHKPPSSLELCDVLQRMVDGYPVNRLDALLPWNWKPAEAVKG